MNVKGYPKLYTITPLTTDITGDCSCHWARLWHLATASSSREVVRSGSAPQPLVSEKASLTQSAPLACLARSASCRWGKVDGTMALPNSCPPLGNLGTLRDSERAVPECQGARCAMGRGFVWPLPQGLLALWMYLALYLKTLWNHRGAPFYSVMLLWDISCDISKGSRKILCSTALAILFSLN